MEIKQIEVVKKWPEPKSVRDIQVFLGFANFNYWFIKSFNKIAAPLTVMLKTTMLSQVLAVNKMLGARVFAANKPSDIKGGDGSSDKSKRMEPKTGRLESQKSAKSWKLSKSRKSKGKKLKKLSKNKNSPNFDTKNSEPSFLTPKARSAINCLR